MFSPTNSKIIIILVNPCRNDMDGTEGKDVGCVKPTSLIRERTTSQRPKLKLRGRCSSAASKVPVERHVQLPGVPIPSTLPCGVLEKTPAEHAHISHFTISHVHKGVVIIVAALVAHPFVSTCRAIPSLRVTTDHALPLHRRSEVSVGKWRPPSCWSALSCWTATIIEHVLDKVPAYCNLESM